MIVKVGFILALMMYENGFVIAQYECSDTVYKELGDLAKRNPNNIQDPVPICDRYLAKHWYAAVNHKMPTTAPDLGACGTMYPYWLDDTLPQKKGTTKSVKVCQVDFSGPCSRSHLIKITNCGVFFVYEMTPLDICTSAYCFEQTASCVTDVPSNPVVAYHGVTWETFYRGVNIVHEPDVNLVCLFGRLPDDTLLYDVTWYADDTEILKHQTVTRSRSDIALLKGTQILAKGKKANSMIQCIVGAKVLVSDIPCKTVSSSLFFAGIKVLNPKLIIPRGGHRDIKLQFTIPFVNQHGIIRKFETQPYLSIAMDIHNSSADCVDDNQNTCETKVYAYKKQETEKYATADWKIIHKIRVYNKDDNDFNVKDKHITLRLKTGGTIGNGSRLFEKLILPDIQVYIEDTYSSWKGAYCESHTDPHMKTFDGKNYECQLDGTFILYRNNHFKQEVQEKHHLCHQAYLYPRCSCAVAVRSGKDVFIVDICNSKSIIHFPSCGDRILKVIKTNDRYYKVIMPTGTLVEIKFVSWPTQNDWQLNIEIYPSPSDVGNSSGLCGILDGDYKNDFTRSDGMRDNPDQYNYSKPPNEFSESWRVKNNELDLFDPNSYDSLMSIAGVLDRVCTCKRNGTYNPTGKIECTYGTYKECKFVVGKKFHCFLNPDGQLRRKRDVHHLEKLFSGAQTVITSITKRDTVPNGKTFEEAKQICSTAFQASRSYQTCLKFVTDLSNTSLVNCISDVMITGDDNFTQIHIQAALEQCSVFVVLNTTFQQTEPDVTNTIKTFCHNNCSGHGMCMAGNCTCETGYAGSDCSFDVLEPPTISHISDFGFCDKSSEICDDITMFGKYFVENMNTKCFIKRHTLKEDGSSLSVVDYVVSLEERTLFEGFCPLEYVQENHWVTIFSFNVSNDGSRFTENFYVYTYQSLCQEYRNDTGNITFVFKDGYCYINNSCVADGSTNRNNKCDICSTEKSKYEWSFNEGHCLISGVCYKFGDIEDRNPCSICDPSVDTTAWSPNADLCFIDGICYGDGQTQTDRDCHVCKPSLSRTKWTLKNECSSTVVSELSTTTQDPNTATSEPSTTTTEPTITTTIQPTSTTPHPTITTPELNTIYVPTTTTLPPEPTSKILELTTTPGSTTTTMEPTTTATEPTTTTREPTAITPKPTTTTKKPTTTIIVQEPSTTTTHEPIITTNRKSSTNSKSATATSMSTGSFSISTQPHCLKSPEKVSVVYHDVSWISSNESNSTTIRTVHKPDINFKCMFNSQHDQSVFYKIDWYVNNATFIKTVTVSEADLDQTTLSSKDMPPLNQAAGLQIHCGVSVSNNHVVQNCYSKFSPFFFAGIKINKTHHNLLRKGKTAVTFYLTIPYVTKTVVENGQTQQLPALEVNVRLHPSKSRCKGSIGVDRCVIEFNAFTFNERHNYDSNDWKQNRTLVLYHVDTDGYEIGESLTVQLKARSDGNSFWNNFNQNISITITDHNEYWKGKSCGSKTDPHMYTFDGASYENHIRGEFILYQNTKFNQEVQTRHKKCHPEYNFPHCTCAISVLSGQDVFLVDLCGDIQFVDFLRCNDSVIQVFKLSDKLYKISLPTGTSVMVSLVEWPVQGSWQIDIDIYPSLSDVNNTAGLCGTLDGDRDNDFTRRTGDTDSVNLVYPDEFSNSWKVLTDENVLEEPLSERQSISSTLDKICLCTPNGDQCSYNTLTHCSKTVEKKVICRELLTQDSSQEWIISHIPQMAKIMITGDYNIRAVHVESSLRQCLTFVGLNTSLQNAYPTVANSLQNVCPSSCSGHGVCDKGNCSCEVGFGGSDCSFGILSPPVIWNSTPNGTCDKSLHQCSRIYFKGRYFLENLDKNCYITKQSIHHNGSMIAFNQLKRPLEEENLFMGSCSLPSDDLTSWITKYMVNVSYNGRQFTQTFSFHTYQSECQQHSVENGYNHFTLKKGYCFINNACVQRAVINPENRCEVCDPGNDVYQWSGKQDCEPESTPKSSDSFSPTSVCIVVILLIIVVVTTVTVIWRCHKLKGYERDELQEQNTNVVIKSLMPLNHDDNCSYIPESSNISLQTYSSQIADHI